MIESERLCYIRNNQTTLRAENYSILRDAAVQGNPSTSTGRRIVLPSTFQGGDKFMNELYHDAIEIWKTYGYLDVFITFTCNSKWLEITRAVNKKGLRADNL